MAEKQKACYIGSRSGKELRELKVLRKIDMDIYKGEVVSVIGPAALAKSTFLNYYYIERKVS